MLTRDQREVVRRVEATMKLDTEGDKIHVKYPLRPEAYLQTENSRQAKAMQTNIEKRLIRDQLMADYKIEMSKALEAGSVVKLSRKEVESWTGPVHFLCHFPVLKPDSVTTKVRIVEVGLLFDLTKAYQQLVTGPEEGHLRRFLYRESSDQAWETYAYD